MRQFALFIFSIYAGISLMGCSFMLKGEVSATISDPVQVSAGIQTGSFLSSQASAPISLSKSFKFEVSYTGADEVLLRPDDIVLAGASEGCVISVSSAERETARIVWLNDCTGNGEVYFVLKAGTAKGEMGTAPQIGPSPNALVDNAPPKVLISTGATVIGVPSDEMYWDIDYADAESVTLDASDVALNGTDITGCHLDFTQVSAKKFKVVVSGCTTPTATDLFLKIAGGTAKDKSGNTALETTSPVMLIDNLGDDSAAWATKMSDPGNANAIFATVWKFNPNESGSNPLTQISLPLVKGVPYLFIVKWDSGGYSKVVYLPPENGSSGLFSPPSAPDGVPNIKPALSLPDSRFDFANFNGSNLTIEILGVFPQFQFSAIATEKDKILTVAHWGNNPWHSMNSMFYNCNNLLGYTGAGPAWDTASPNLSHVQDMSYMFSKTENFLGGIGNWDVSNVTNMSHMFDGAGSLNEPLASWNVSSVTDMSYMFADTADFDQALNSWNVSKVTNMSHMFKGAHSFNQPLNNWVVSGVIDMSYMFADTWYFDQALNSWDVSKATNMSYMFADTWDFNQALNSWNVSSVTDMSYMFWGARSFANDLSGWSVQNVKSWDGFGAYSQMVPIQLPGFVN